MAARRLNPNGFSSLAEALAAAELSGQGGELIFLEKTARNRHFGETLLPECDISEPQ